MTVKTGRLCIPTDLRSAEVHNGLIIIMPAVPRHEQMRLFAMTLDVAEHQNSLINLLIEVRADRVVEVRNWVEGPVGLGSSDLVRSHQRRISSRRAGGMCSERGLHALPASR